MIKLASKTEKKEIAQRQQYLSLLQLRLIELLRENGSMTRDQICEEFRFKKHRVDYTDSYLGNKKGKTYHNVVEQYSKRTTIFDNLIKLQKRKLVEKFSRSNGKRGRPMVYWKIKDGL